MVVDYISAIAALLWPLIFIVILIMWGRPILERIRSGEEFAFEMFGGKIGLKPAKPPLTEGELPAIAEREEIPTDYVYLNHTSFLREDKQQEFKAITKVDAPHYDIRVIVDSYYRGALDRINHVEYILHQAYPEPIQVRSQRSDRFMLKELANGEYVLQAKVFFRDRKKPLILSRYITLWKEGQRLD